MAEEKKPEEAVEEVATTEVVEAEAPVAAEVVESTTDTEARTVLDHRAKLKQMDEIRGF